MNHELFKKLHQEGLVGEESFEKISQEAKFPLRSIFWEINTLLGIGVLALSTGLGILVYKNIDTIGHQAILALIAGISIACFAYCGRKNPPFSSSKVADQGKAYDYILLLGTLTMLTFVAYLQFQYQVFGSRYGLATFVPMVALFFIAYYFDHLAVLNLAILNLGIWMGVSITPKQLLLASNYNSSTIIFTYLGLGLLLLFLAFVTGYYKFKPHFKFSYQHYGLHLSFISLLAAYAQFYDLYTSFLWLLALILLAFLQYREAMQNRSTYFLVLAVLYAYVATSCLVCRLLLLPKDADSGVLLLFLLYFPTSATACTILLKRLIQKIKAA
jgi:hypothetical protein